MQKKSPQSNNPVNPLNKVAALTLEREETLAEQTPSGLKVPIRVRLSFNESRQMKGEARDTDKEKVVVSFSLAVRGATLDLTARFVDPTSQPSHKLSFRDIAHQAAIVKPAKVRGTATTKRKRGASLAGKASAEVKSSKTGKLKAVGGASGSAAAAYGTEGRAGRTMAFDELNVGATGTGDAVHWEIACPRLASNTLNAVSRTEACLIGEVFKAADGQDMLAARLINGSATGGNTALAVELTASVRALMADLIVKDVKFFDKTGEELAIARLDPQLIWPSRGPIALTQELVDRGKEALGLNADRLRGRIMREIIRKHLASEGLDTSGADVEICKAQG